MAALEGQNANNFPYRCIAGFTTSVFVVITLTASGPATYRFAIFFLAPFLWGLYCLRSRLAMPPLYFAFFAAGLVLHNLGAYGFYRRDFLGLEFDAYVHAYFGFAGALILAQALQANQRLRKWSLWLGSLLLLLGFGAIHELIEYASTLLLGPEKGMLKLGDPFDTHKDLFNNLIGGLAALLFHQLRAQSRPLSISRVEPKKTANAI